ncbi:hypothetical protein E3N88_37169 [Mikania micrantha]|uniref:CCHC-type domain-containing protein n=1 Tax=Mikania micrantha TaxID=192012 RepID=A0A5N6M5T7_9ASTR|nr:hypothetical protein E3N88_37169 [Mikania micrantha]
MTFENTQTDPAITAAINRTFSKQLPNMLDTIMGRLNHNNHNSIPPPPLYPPPHIPDPPPYSPPHIPDPPPFGPETHIYNTTSEIHDWLTRFQKQKPRFFSYAPDPIDACNWIMHVEKIFEVLGVEEQYKVRLAAYKLEDDAQSWWRGIKHAHGGDVFAAMLAWNEFKEIFYRQYFLTSHQEKYYREYATIAQRDDEPMREFMARFTRLASFLGDAAGNQQTQANKLKWAVCERVRKMIVMMKFNNITEVADAVQTLELAKQVKPSGESKKREREGDSVSYSGQPSSQSSFSKSYKPKFNHNQYSGYNRNQFGQHNSQQFRSGNPKPPQNKPNQNRTLVPYVNNRAQPLNQYPNPPPPCTTCGKPHRGICRFTRGLCFRCGQTGHLVKDCPQPDTRANIGGNSGKTTAGGRVFALTAHDAAKIPGANFCKIKFL